MFNVIDYKIEWHDTLPGNCPKYRPNLVCVSRNTEFSGDSHCISSGPVDTPNEAINSAVSFLKKRFRTEDVEIKDGLFRVTFPKSPYKWIRIVMQNDGTVNYNGSNDDTGEDGELKAEDAFMLMGPHKVPFEVVFSHPDDIDNIYETECIKVWIENQ